jgi:hypothetical protein
VRQKSGAFEAFRSWQAFDCDQSGVSHNPSIVGYSIGGEQVVVRQYPAMPVSGDWSALTCSADSEEQPRARAPINATPRITET